MTEYCFCLLFLKLACCSIVDLSLSALSALSNSAASQGYAPLADCYSTMSMTTNLRTMCCRLMDGCQRSRQASTRHPQRLCSLVGKMPCRGKAWFPCTGSCKPDPQAGTPKGTTPKCWRLPVALADLPLSSRYYRLRTPLFCTFTSSSGPATFAICWCMG